MFRKKLSNIKARSIVRVLLIFICIAVPVMCMAQGPPDPEDTPIDGGLSLLIAAGAAYGIKKHRDHKTANKK
jgi:hypothetical protein